MERNFNKDIYPSAFYYANYGILSMNNNSVSFKICIMRGSEAAKILVLEDKKRNFTAEMKAYIYFRVKANVSSNNFEHLKNTIKIQLCGY
ncbi:hypothetical protein GA0116948_101423 [Chitinophaga costaii]|uniref:Uncharacterized protein n=1 Tax=Chitinophaga costaii TaxID=1335309 RepID=A0A1C3ZJD8_9BACT|nr:hypothetical protein DCM91_02680 [Chitinophaga costaii]SCB82413.1 hypothetical protein GA0116948_101423 [Chitinophaga costaii]